METQFDLDEYKFYDFGWNAFLDGKPFNAKGTIDWRDGWRDCRDAKESDRQKI